MTLLDRLRTYTIFVIYEPRGKCKSSLKNSLEFAIDLLRPGPQIDLSPHFSRCRYISYLRFRRAFRRCWARIRNLNRGKSVLIARFEKDYLAR